jgi:hypothetical protein
VKTQRSLFDGLGPDPAEEAASGLADPGPGLAPGDPRGPARGRRKAAREGFGDPGSPYPLREAVAAEVEQLAREVADPKLACAELVESVLTPGRATYERQCEVLVAALCHLSRAEFARVAAAVARELRGPVDGGDDDPGPGGGAGPGDDLLGPAAGGSPT